MIVFRTNLLRLAREKANFLSMLLMPVIFVVLIFLFGGMEGEHRIAVANNDNTALTRAFIEKLEKQNEVVILDEESARQSLIDREVGNIIVIPYNFTNDIIRGNKPMLTGHKIQETVGAFSSNMFIEGFMNSMQRIAKASEGNEERFYLGVEEYLRAPFGVEVKLFEYDLGRARMIAGMGFLTMGMLFFATSAAGILVEDKKKRILHRLLATTLTIKQYMLENIACFFILLLAQMTIVFIILNRILEIGWQSYFINLYLLTIVFTVLSIAFGIAISGIAKDTRQSTSIGTLIITPLIMIGGGFWPRHIMPVFMQRLGYISPVTWFMKAGEKIAEGASFLGVYREVGILLLFTLAFFLVGTFKKADIAS